MKTLYLFFFCLIIGNISSLQTNAQNTPPFNYLDYSCEWYNYHSSSLQYDHFTYEIIYIDGDTLINDELYFKRYYAKKDSIVPLNILSNEETVVRTTTGYFDAIRESDSKQFYVVYKGRETENLLIDFGLELGDNLPDFLDECMVQYIDTVLLGNRPLQQYHPYTTNSDGAILEGVGQTGPLCSISIEGSNRVCAFRKQEDTLYFCDKNRLAKFLKPNRVHTITTIPTMPQVNASFEVYPNPVQQQLTINSPINNWATGKIFNTLGQLIYEFKITDLNSKLDVSWLKTGMYLMQLNDEHHQAYTSKFIKE